MAKINTQEKLLPIMTVALIGAAFALGIMWGKVQVYEGNGIVAGEKTETADLGNNQPTQPNQAPPDDTPIDQDLWQEILKDPTAQKGQANAKVTIVEFTDYQCPFCNRYFEQTYPQISKDYIDSGKVNYIIRDLPLSFHANAKPASLAARCAGDQDKYWQMHDKLFENQDSWSNGSTDEIFKGYATEIGLNQSTFNSCYDSGKYNDAIDADLSLATKVGATGTPTFFINSQKLVGAQPFASFQAVIDEQL